jgi:hypothetical protein
MRGRDVPSALGDDLPLQLNRGFPLICCAYRHFYARNRHLKAGDAKLLARPPAADPRVSSEFDIEIIPANIFPLPMQTRAPANADGNADAGLNLARFAAVLSADGNAVPGRMPRNDLHDPLTGTQSASAISGCCRR